MPKDWRDEHLPSVSEQRRQDPTPNQRKAKRNKQRLPPHWEVRQHRWGYAISVYRARPEIPYYWWLDQKERPDRHDLPALLDWYAGAFPHTANLPVRFISCQPVECGRQILP